MSITHETTIQLTAAPAPVDSPPGIPVLHAWPAPPATRRANWKLRAAVFLPALLVCVYFWVFAADRYQSEATFVVRNPGAGTVAEIANLMQGTKILTNAEDSYIVHEYIRSRDAMRLMLSEGLLEVFQGYGDDFLWAYPPLFGKGNDEKLFQQYQRFVDVTFDKTTGISTLRVQAFDPKDASRIATALLASAEKIINRLNERAQKDTLQTAEREVEAARRSAAEDQQRVTDFRIRESMIDPARFSSAVVVETLARLSFELAMANAQMSQLMKSAPKSIQVEGMKVRMAALQDQIALERKQLSAGPTSYAPLIDEYEKLIMKKEFSERLLQSALTSFDLSRVEATRQRLFLETISTPVTSDYPNAPLRIIWTIVSLMLSMLVFWMLRALAEDTASHAGT